MPGIERLKLATVEAGATIQVKASEDPEAYLYSFTVLEPGEMPYCDFSQTSPDGSIIGPVNALLEGTGDWTTPEQNPCQRSDPAMGRPWQERAMSIGWGALHLGGFVVALDATEREKMPKDRYELLPEVTKITLEHPSQ